MKRRFVTINVTSAASFAPITAAAAVQHMAAKNSSVRIASLILRGVAN
jgi:hypothetical protein